PSAMLLNGEPIRQPFTSRTAVDVLGRNIDEVLLAKTTCGFCARGQRFRQCDRDAGRLTGKNFLAIVVAAISDNAEYVDTHLGTSLRSHAGELVAVAAHIGHLVSHDEMMLRINRNLHVVANDAGVLATCRHRACIRIGERDLLVLALHHLRVDRVEPDDLLLELLDLALQPLNFRLRHRIAMPIGWFKLREIAGDALIDTLKTPLHLGLGEVLVPSIDGLELRSIDGDACCNKQIKLAAQRDELATDLTDGLAIVLAEIRDGLEVRRQLSGQPDHLDIALAFPLQAPARRNPIKIAVDVELEHNTGAIAGSAGIEGLDTDKPELIEIETVDEHVDRTHRVMLGYIVVERCRKQRALPAIHPI